MTILSCYRKRAFLTNGSDRVDLYDLEELTGWVVGFGAVVFRVSIQATSQRYRFISW